MKNIFKYLYLLLGVINIIEGFSLFKGFSLLFQQEIYVPFDIVYAYWSFILYFIIINIIIIVFVVFNKFKFVKISLVFLAFNLIIFLYFSLNDMNCYRSIIILIEVIMPCMYLNSIRGI